MSGPVDLSNLREITGGDANVERELFDIFLQSSGECLAALKNTCAADRADEWRRQAHSFKGTSLNLGAGRLGRLCKEAQDGFQEPPEKKREMLAAIESEFVLVRDYLKTATVGQNETAS